MPKEGPIDIPAKTGSLAGIGVTLSFLASATIFFARKGARNLMDGIFLTSFNGVREISPNTNTLGLTDLASGALAGSDAES